MSHVCPHYSVWTFDNLFRPLIHNPQKIFSPYISPGISVLDVGCGAGFTTIALARMIGAEGTITAVDIQPEMLQKVKKKALRAGIEARITFTQCTEDSLQIVGKYEFINTFWMVHEVPDQGHFFDQLAEASQPGSKMLIVEPMFHVSRKSFEETVAQAEYRGFKILNRPPVRFSHAVAMQKK